MFNINNVGINKQFFRYTVEDPFNGWSKSYNGVDYNIEINNDTCYIKFQKTIDSRDWQRNLSFFPTFDFTLNSKLCLFHNGFLKGSDSCIGYIVKEISKNQKQIKNIIISGYSQGAAIALITYYELKQIYMLKNIQVYAFAPPRISFFLFSWNIRKILKKANLIMARGDLVTKQPPWWLGFLHIGKKYKIGKWKFFDTIECHNVKYYEQYLEDCL